MTLNTRDVQKLMERTRRLEVYVFRAHDVLSKILDTHDVWQAFIRGDIEDYEAESLGSQLVEYLEEARELRKDLDENEETKMLFPEPPEPKETKLLAAEQRVIDGVVEEARRLFRRELPGGWGRQSDLASILRTCANKVERREAQQ